MVAVNVTKALPSVWCVAERGGRVRISDRTRCVAQRGGIVRVSERGREWEGETRGTTMKMGWDMRENRERESKKRNDFLLIKEIKSNKKLPKNYSIFDCTVPKIKQQYSLRQKF